MHLPADLVGAPDPGLVLRHLRHHRRLPHRLPGAPDRDRQLAVAKTDATLARFGETAKKWGRGVSAAGAAVGNSFANMEKSEAVFSRKFARMSNKLLSIQVALYALSEGMDKSDTTFAKYISNVSRGLMTFMAMPIIEATSATPAGYTAAIYTARASLAMPFFMASRAS